MRLYSQVALQSLPRSYTRIQTFEALLEAILLQVVQSGRHNQSVIPCGGFSSYGRGRTHMGRARGRKRDVPGLGSSFPMTESIVC